MTTTTTPTVQQVQDLYRKLNNKTCFLVVFGTTKFALVEKNTLAKMYHYLLKKVK